MVEYRRARDRFAMPFLDQAVTLAGFDWDGAEASRLMREMGRVTTAECQFLSERRPVSVTAA